MLMDRMGVMVFRAVQVRMALTDPMVKTVRMVPMVSAVIQVHRALPAPKVHRVSLVSVDLPVRTDPMVKTVRMAARWCLCTVPGAAWL